MAGMTLERAQQMLELCLEAEAAIYLGFQEKKIADRTYRRAELEQLAARTTFWQGQVDRLTNGSPSGYVIRPTQVVEHPTTEGGA